MRTTTLTAAAWGAALAIATAPAAEAADEDGSFALRGFGAETCSTAVEQIQADGASAANAVAWLLGYMTAVNRAQADAFDVSPITDGGAMLQMVAGICEDNPDELVETVAYDLLRTLAVARVRESSEVVETSANGHSAPIRQETLVEMQSRLIALGHLDGEADGLYGPATRAALRSFQEDQDLQVTGIADSVTVVRLLVELAEPE